MQQCGIKQEGRLRDATMWLKQEGQAERCNNVVKAGKARLRDATMWLKQEGQAERCNNVVKARRLG